VFVVFILHEEATSKITATNFVIEFLLPTSFRNQMQWKQKN